jgi:hypothetical protein
MARLARNCGRAQFRCFAKFDDSSLGRLNSKLNEARFTNILDVKKTISHDSYICTLPVPDDELQADAAVVLIDSQIENRSNVGGHGIDTKKVNGIIRCT